MSKSMETNTAAIYLRKSTEDDGKSVAQQERELRTKADQTGVKRQRLYSPRIALPQSKSLQA